MNIFEWGQALVVVALLAYLVGLFVHQVVVSRRDLRAMREDTVEDRRRKRREELFK